MALDAQALISRDAAKAYLGVTDTDRDEQIDDLINQASEWIIATAQQEFAPMQDAATRIVEYRGGGEISLAPFSLRSITGVTFDPSGSSPEIAEAGSFQLRYAPKGKRFGVYNRIANRSSVPAYGAIGGVGQVAITGNWGWPFVPRDIERACRRLVEMWFRSEIAFTSDEFADGALPLGIPLDLRDTVEAYRLVRAGAV